MPPSKPPVKSALLLPAAADVPAAASSTPGTARFCCCLRLSRRLGGVGAAGLTCCFSMRYCCCTNMPSSSTALCGFMTLICPCSRCSGMPAAWKPIISMLQHQSTACLLLPSKQITTACSQCNSINCCSKNSRTLLRQGPANVPHSQAMAASLTSTQKLLLWHMTHHDASSPGNPYVPITPHPPGFLSTTPITSCTSAFQ